MHLCAQFKSNQTITHGYIAFKTDVTLTWPLKVKDPEVNWEIIYDFLYVFLINFSPNMLNLLKTTSWKINDLDLTF